jgi:hypothetical protein
MKNLTRPETKHFSVINREIVVKQSAKLLLPNFHHRSAWATETVYHQSGQILQRVSTHVYEAVQSITVLSNLEAVKELCVLCYFYDGQGVIHWPNTFMLIREKLVAAQFKKDFTDRFMMEIVSALPRGRSESVLK